MADDRITWDKDKAVLLLVDIQPDFMPGGALPVAEGDHILAPVRNLMLSERFGLLVATQDWHPPGHASFASRYSGRKPLETIELHGHQQTLWPDHCVQGSKGAALHPELPWDRVAAIIRKGMDSNCDSYSGFRNNWNAKGERSVTGLAGYLQERGITDVFLCGLARDVCVKWTAEDGLAAGFRIIFLWDATRAVDPECNDQVRRDLLERGIEIVNMNQLSM